MPPWTCSVILCRHALQCNSRAMRIHSPQLTDSDLARFRDIYKKIFGEDVPEAEARALARDLVRLYQILLQPTPSELAKRLAKDCERAIVEESPDTSTSARDDPQPSK